MFGHSPWTRGTNFRVLACTLTVALASPPVDAVYAESSPPGAEGLRELYAQAQDQIQQARAQNDPRRAAEHYAEAAGLYARAAAQMPETAANRPKRDELLGKVVSSAQEAHNLAKEDRQPLRAALAVVLAHIDALERAYGDGVGSLPEYSEAQRRLIILRSRLGPAPSAPVSPPGPEPAGPAPRTQTPTASGWPAPPTSTVAQDPAPARLDWPRLGFGVSITLAGVSLAATLGTSLSVIRKPFTGRLYADILDAANANDIAHESSDDMCALGRTMAVPDLIDACAQRDRVARAAIAMATLTVLSTGSAVVFGVLMARRKKPRNAAMVTPGVISLPGGMFIGASGRF